MNKMIKKTLLVCAFSLTALGVFAQVGSAVSSLSSGKLDNAKTAIDKAITEEKASSKSKTWFYRGEVYKAIASDPTGMYSKLDTNALQVSFESYQKAIDLEKNSTFAKQATEKIKELFQVAMAQGSTKYQANDYASSATAFTLARQLNPQDTTAALYSGISHQQNKNYKAAAESFESLIGLGTNDASIYSVLASIYRSFNDNDKALNILKQGAQKFPNNKQLKEEEFNLYISSGKTEEAKSNLLESIQREPNNALFHQNLGILYDQTGEKDKAMESYQKALAIDPNNFDGNFNLGVLHYNKGADISKKIREMDLKQYQKDGKRMEGEMKASFKKALPYFEKCYQVKKDDLNVLQPLENIYRMIERTADADKINKEIQSLNK